jgi:hypothetical protein
MSIFSDLLAGGAEGLLKGIGSFAISIRTAITGEAPIDATKRAELLIQAQAIEAAQEKALLDFEEKVATGQMAINALEAQNASVFVSGWRPMIGWICGSGLLYTFILRPLLPWIITVVAMAFGVPVVLPALPALEMGELIPLLMGMLGIGAMRSYDKIATYKIDSTENSKKGERPAFKTPIKG